MPKSVQVHEIDVIRRKADAASILKRSEVGGGGKNTLCRKSFLQLVRIFLSKPKKSQTWPHCLHLLQMYYAGRTSSPVYSLAFDSSHLFVALDKGINMLDFSVK